MTWCTPGKCDPDCHRAAYWHTGETIIRCECKCHPKPGEDWKNVARN